MSTYDTYTKRMDPTPQERSRFGRPLAEGRATVADAIAFCEENGLNPAEVLLGHNYLTWTSPESDDEIAQRVDWAAREREKHLRFVWDMLGDYTARGLYDGMQP